MKNPLTVVRQLLTELTPCNGRTPNKSCEDLFNSSYPSFILVFHLMSGEQTPDMATCNSFELYKNKKCMVLKIELKIQSLTKFTKN
jgi:hypothetical protein